MYIQCAAEEWIERVFYEKHNREARKIQKKT